MTVEQMIEAIQRTPWRVWAIGQGSHGTWSCRLIDESWHGRSSFGFDAETNGPWRVGRGPTMLTAISAAAHGLILDPWQQDILNAGGGGILPAQTAMGGNGSGY